MKNTILITVFLLLISNTFAAEQLVPSQYPTIQAAIDAAIDGDTVIVEQNTYRENINFLGKAITVRSINPGSWETIKATIIHGGGPKFSRSSIIGSWGSCVVFDHSETSNSILEGFTLTNGFGNSIDRPDSLHIYSTYVGGGILCVDSSPTIRHCNIKGNGGEYYTSGGGVALIGNCEAVIINCFITDNTAEGGSGVIIRSNSPEQTISEFRNCTIANNNMSGDEPYEEYEVDCWDTRPIIYNTIIWSKDTRSLLIADPSLITYSCLREVYIFDENYDELAEPYELITGTGNISQKPRFAHASTQHSQEQDYYYHLSQDSHCINAGDPAFTGSGETDIDGQSRIMAGRIDIGADEVVPEIIVHKPAGGETWSAGSTHEIVWSSYNAGTINIRFSEDSSTTFQPIESGIPDTGSFVWQLPDVMDSNQCVILVEPSIADSNVVLIESGLFTIQPYSPGSEVESKWKSLGGDFNRTSLSEYSGPELGCIKWKFETDSAVPSSITIGFNDRVHIACENGKLYTLDDDGSLIWSYDANSQFLSSPTIGPDGTLYVGSQNGKLYAIDINGNLQWTHDTDGLIYSSPAVSADGRVYVGSQDGVLYALGPNGSELWSFVTDGIADLSGSILASPSIGIDGSVYIGGLYDPNLYALDPSTGALKWKCNFESQGWPFASPVVATDGTIYQTMIYDSNLYAIDHNNGAIIWSTDLADPHSGFFDPNYSENYSDSSGWSEPALGPDGTIYVSFDDPYLRTVDPDGNIKWVTHLGTIGGFTLTVGNNGLIYAASDDGLLYVVNPDGQEVSRFESDNWLSYLVITADDTIIVADSKDNSLLIEYTKNTVFAISPQCSEGQTPDLDWVGDLNSDGNVNFNDIAMLAEQWLNKE